MADPLGFPLVARFHRQEAVNGRIEATMSKPTSRDVAGGDENERY
ncbi:hypothetical protein [Bradyrhizobium lablabi]|nr:hypothetical protein [Bradyrhizobium lablabi]